MRRLLLVTSLSLLSLGSCSSPGAVQGATSGAFYGAVSSGMVAAVFGGDVGDSLAYGAAVGGTVGAISGAQADSARRAREQQIAAIQSAGRQPKAEYQPNADELRATLVELVGPDCTRGLEHLVQFRHEEASRSARLAAVSDNREYRLAALWLQAMIALDRGDEREARSVYPTIVVQDEDIATEEAAGTKARELVTELEDTRAEFGLERRRG